jgi:hypothetical protein
VAQAAHGVGSFPTPSHVRARPLALGRLAAVGSSSHCPQGKRVVSTINGRELYPGEVAAMHDKMKVPYVTSKVDEADAIRSSRAKATVTTNNKGVTTASGSGGVAAPETLFFQHQHRVSNIQCMNGVKRLMKTELPAILKQFGPPHKGQSGEGFDSEKVMGVDGVAGFSGDDDDDNKSMTPTELLGFSDAESRKAAMATSRAKLAEALKSVDPTLADNPNEQAMDMSDDEST